MFYLLIDLQTYYQVRRKILWIYFVLVAVLVSSISSLEDATNTSASTNRSFKTNSTLSLDLQIEKSSENAYTQQSGVLKDKNASVAQMLHQQKTFAREKGKVTSEGSVLPHKSISKEPKNFRAPQHMKKKITSTRPGHGGLNKKLLPHNRTQNSKMSRGPYSSHDSNSKSPSANDDRRFDRRSHISSKAPDHVNEVPTGTINPETIYGSNRIPNVRHTATYFPRNKHVFKPTTDNAKDLRRLSSQKLEKKRAPEATILKVYLNNDGHSVLVTWEIQQDTSNISGFIVSYKMEGRENYDSSKLGKQVRKFTLHSLHEDKEYSICVIALLKDDPIMEECKGWSRASSKMFVGIIAGGTLMVPCLAFLIFIVYKDRRVKQKIKVRAQQEALDEESQKNLIDAKSAMGGNESHDNSNQQTASNHCAVNVHQMTNGGDNSCSFIENDPTHKVSGEKLGDKSATSTACQNTRI